MPSESRKLSFGQESNKHKVRARLLWKKHLIKGISEKIQNPLTVLESLPEIPKRNRPNFSVFVPGTNSSLEELKAYDEKIRREHNVYSCIIPANLPLIEAATEEFIKLFSFSEKKILSTFIHEGRPYVHEIGEKPVTKKEENEAIVSFMKGSYPAALIEIYKQLARSVKRAIPVVSDANYDEILYIVTSVPISELVGGITLEELENLKQKNEKTSEIIALEGAQGSGKTTISQLLKKIAKLKTIPLAIDIKPQKDPMVILKRREALTNKLLPFSPRQDVVRQSMEERISNAESQHGTMGILDRSPFSAIMTHITTSALNGTVVDHQIDAELLRSWLNNHPNFSRALILVLTQSDPYQSFFRLRTDQATDNQEAKFSTQILERIFYNTLVYLGIAHYFSVDNKSPAQIAREILTMPKVKTIIEQIKKTRAKTEWLKNWWGQESRIGVWFSTRLGKSIKDEELIQRAKQLIMMNPDMVFVGAARDITIEDQRRALKLAKQAKAELKSQVMIIDWPSDPTLITGEGDFSVIMNFINSSDRDLNHDRMAKAVEFLSREEKPYLVCGYGLFDNGSSKHPSVAITGRIDNPWPESMPTIADKDIFTEGKNMDFFYIDRGSNPSAGPLSPDAISHVIATLGKVTQSNLPPVMIGGGITTETQAKSLIKIHGVTTVTVGTIFENNPNLARKIIAAINKAKTKK